MVVAESIENVDTGCRLFPELVRGALIQWLLIVCLIYLRFPFLSLHLGDGIQYEACGGRQSVQEHKCDCEYCGGEARHQTGGKVFCDERKSYDKTDSRKDERNKREEFKRTVVLKRVPIMTMTLITSLMVLSLDSDPAGRSRYSMDTSLIRQRWPTAWMDSSVSIWKPSESSGSVLTKSLLWHDSQS